MTTVERDVMAAAEPSAARPIGRRSTLRTILKLLLIVAAASGGWWAFWHHHAKRFQEVRKGIFYRVAQPSELGFRYLIDYLGIKTVVSVQLYDFRLHRGLVSWGVPDGCRESEYVEKLGARPVQWPMGVEKSWPWLTPWQFEEFFRLMDDPDNWPVAVHCQGGRHRTGTMAALYRLEYDRWPVDRALREMYSFKFGGAIRLQEHNLRTYLPRPHPNAADWAEMAHLIDGASISWAPRPPQLDEGATSSSPAAEYEAFVRLLRTLRKTRPDIDEPISAYLERDGRFSIPLCQRLIDQPDDPLVPLAAAKAAQAIESVDAGTAAWSMAAALLADFGSRPQQERLLVLLNDAVFQQGLPERFDALVDGLTNRYTANRLAFLVPLLDNESPHLREGCRQYRYCDTAVARLSAIVDENFPDVIPAWGIDAWNNGRVAARKWLLLHPDEAKLRQLVPPTGQTEVLPGDPVPREDLSRAKY